MLELTLEAVGTSLMTNFYQQSVPCLWTCVRKNPIQSGCSQLRSNPVHKYLVLNRTRELYATNYSYGDL